MKDVRRVAEVVFFCAVLVLSSGAFGPLWSGSLREAVGSHADHPLQWIWFAIYSIAIVGLIPYRKDLLSLVADNRSLALLSILSFASAAWSEDPALTLRRSVALLGTTLVAALFALRFDLQGQFKLLATALGLAAVASVAAHFQAPASFHPTEFAGAAWNGVFSHKNLLGRAMSLGVLAFCLWKRRTATAWLVSAGGAAVCFALLLASDSKTAIVALVAILLLAPMVGLRRWRWRLASGAALILFALGVPIAALGISNVGAITESLHREITLTGRLHIWEVACQSFSEQPWLGYGFGAFWRVAGESQRALSLIGYNTPHAHNGVLDLGLQLGASGILIFFAGWFGKFVKALRISEPTPLLFLLFLVFSNLTESSLLVPNALLWILYVSVCIGITRADREPCPIQ